MGERDDGQIKLHKRTVVLDRTPRTVLSPRPSDGHRWATNRYHDDWHVLSDHEGGRRLGRLLWIMAAQEPGTLLVIDQSCLVPNPFDADPSTPIVIANHGDGLGAAALDDLARVLPFRTPSTGTVKVRTQGIEGERGEWEHWLDRRGRLRATHGLLLMAGTREMLREWAYACVRLAADDRGDEAEDYTYIMIERGRALEAEAEVQTFRSFALWCEQARLIREELFPGRSRSPLTEDERRRVWERLPPRHRV